MATARRLIPVAVVSSDENTSKKAYGNRICENPLWGHRVIRLGALPRLEITLSRVL